MLRYRQGENKDGIVEGLCCSADDNERSVLLVDGRKILYFAKYSIKLLIEE